jgi:hypothetical protein
MKNQETPIQDLIMLALSEAGCKVWRNETAGAWVGNIIHRSGRQVTLANATMLSFGLAIGSSDIIGLTPSGRFLALEVKTQTGRPTKEQRIFLKIVSDSGGIAGIVRTPEQALQLIR